MYDCIFLDRDGTLNPTQVLLIIFQILTFMIYSSSFENNVERNNRFCIVTNQSGVARGLSRLKPYGYKQFY